MDIWIFLPAPWHSESYIGFCRIKIPELLKLTWPRPCYKCFLRRTPPFYHSTIKSTWLPHQITLKGLTMSWSQNLGNHLDLDWYCWWKKSRRTSWFGKYPVIYKVLQILELVQYFFHQPYHLKFRAIFQVDFVRSYGFVHLKNQDSGTPNFPNQKIKSSFLGKKEMGPLLFWRNKKIQRKQKKNGPFFQIIVPRIPMFDGGAPLGISPSQPWPDFASDLRPPDHPGERVISNLKRFAGGKICCLSYMGYREVEIKT